MSFVLPAAPSPSCVAEALPVVSRPLRTEFAVAFQGLTPGHIIPCVKGGFEGSQRGLAARKRRVWTYPPWVNSRGAQAEFRKDDQAARRHQRLLNLGFHECLICTGIIKRRPASDGDREVQCRNKCSAYFHQECADKWVRSNPSCPGCRRPMFEGGGLDPNDISQSIVAYATDRVLEDTYFEDQLGGYHEAQPFLEISDNTYHEFKMTCHPMYTHDDEFNPNAPRICGHYFLPMRDPIEGIWWNGCVDDEDSDDDEDEGPDFEGRSRLFYTLRRHRLRPESWDEFGAVDAVVRHLRDARDPRFTLCYNVYDSSHSVWTQQHEEECLRRIATSMVAMGLSEGGEDVQRQLTTLEEDFEWPEGVDFVLWGDDSLEIRPEALADYIEENGELW